MRRSKKQQSVSLWDNREAGHRPADCGVIVLGMSRRLLNIEKRSVPSFKLRGVGLASKNAM